MDTRSQNGGCQTGRLGQSNWRQPRVRAVTNLGLQEAKDSSELENIVTTHDELFRDDVHPESFANPAAKEVLRYRQALRYGFEQVRASGLLTANHIIDIQAHKKQNSLGRIFRFLQPLG